MFKDVSSVISRQREEEQRRKQEEMRERQLLMREEEDRLLEEYRKKQERLLEQERRFEEEMARRERELECKRLMEPAFFAEHSTEEEVLDVTRNTEVRRRNNKCHKWNAALVF